MGLYTHMIAIHQIHCMCACMCACMREWMGECVHLCGPKLWLISSSSRKHGTIKDTQWQHFLHVLTETWIFEIAEKIKSNNTQKKEKYANSTQLHPHWCTHYKLDLLVRLHMIPSDRHRNRLGRAGSVLYFTEGRIPSPATTMDATLNTN